MSAKADSPRRGRLGRALIVLGLLLSLASAGASCSGSPGAPTPAGGGGADPTASPSAAAMTLSADVSASSSRTITFRADIAGGRDDDQALFCQALTWDFGDGPPMTLTPGCVAWTADSKIQRQFTATHEYEKAGTYTVTFTYARLTASRAVVVR